MLRGLRHLCTSRRGLCTAPPPPPPPSPQRLLLLHNPRCSKSRAALALLQEHAPRCGARLDVREYLRQPLSAADLGALVRMLGCASPWDICREAEARALGFRGHAAAAAGAADDDAGDAGVLEAMVRNPSLLQRPLLVCLGSKRAVLGRPPERVLELLPPPADVEAVAAAAAEEEEEEARSPRWRANSAGLPLPPPPPPPSLASSSSISSSSSWVPPALPQSGAPAWEVREGEGEGEGGWSPPARATAPAQEEAGAGAETQRARRRPAQYREFVPSDSWAEVEEDHICPGGCEYRIDMDTGVKLARWAR